MRYPGFIISALRGDLLQTAHQRMVHLRMALARHLLYAGFQPDKLPAWLGFFERTPVLAMNMAVGKIKPQYRLRLKKLTAHFVIAQRAFGENQAKLVRLSPAILLN